MQYWEVEDSVGDLVRITWNESATFNLQSPIGGQWVDWHCFTCYGINDASSALAFAKKILENCNKEGTDDWITEEEIKACW